MDESSTGLAMRPCRPSCHSLRDLFCVVVAVATLSVLATYHLSSHLPPRHPADLQTHLNGGVGVVDNIQDPSALRVASGRQTSLASGTGDKRRDLEGLDVDNWEQRMQERRRRKDGNMRRKLDPELLRKVKRLDDELLPPITSHKLAVIEVTEGTINKQTVIYQEALNKAGYTLATIGPSDIKSNTSIQPGLSSYNQSNYHRYSRQVWDTGWSVGLCLYLVDPERIDYAKGQSLFLCQHRNTDNLQPFQKFSIIPALDSMFINKQHFCRTMTAIRYIPALLGNPISPLCYLLPTQYEEFLTEADAKGPGSYWVLKPLEQENIPVQLVEPASERDYLKIKRLTDRPTLVQEYLPSPLSLFGLRFTVTVYVLVTSWRPLRAHIHTQGIVHFRHDYQRNFQKIPGRTWTLEQWLRHVAETHTQGTADIAQRNMEIVIVETLLATEVVASHDQQIKMMLGNKLKRCSGCFQLLGFELIFNSTFYPSIINIVSNPDLSDSIHLVNWVGGTINDHVIYDVISMVTTNTPAVADIAMALEELNLDSDLNLDRKCTDASDIRTCLLPGDVQYWLSLRREFLQKGGFKLLYPSIDADKYNTFVSSLDRLTKLHPHHHHHSPTDSELSVHSTTSLHHLTISFLRYLHNLERIEESYDDLNVPWFSDVHLQSEDSNKNLLQNVYLKESSIENQHIKHSCVDDQIELPFLEGIYTDPPLDLSPVFNKSVTDYYATVPYDVFLVKIWAYTISCFSEARLEDKYGLSRPSNFTLGLGNNKISIIVVDVRHTEPWAVGVYTLNVYRQQVSEGMISTDHSQPHTVCSLTQDCGLPYLPSEPCGLQQSVYSSWQQYRKHASVLPPCQKGDESGQWLVPCRSCNHSDSCSWSSAIWQPHHCVHKMLSRNVLKQCLAQKQILFIGDSTNRGIMHYLMEQVNETLTEWDKTHNIKTYTNINRDQTTISFAYYPQFWLPVNQRPAFDTALLDLMKQSGPLQNNHSTVLVVGGVHWLATHHLKVISQILLRQGLDNIKVVVKALGAGFHQPVDGLHCLTLSEQRKLFIHNAGLVEFCHSQGFEVVDTFSMTMARYKDFLQGKCACHFHRVREVLPSFTQYMRSTGQRGNTKFSNMPILYHVEGDINAVYSEILINRICDDNWS